MTYRPIGSGELDIFVTIEMYLEYQNILHALLYRQWMYKQVNSDNKIVVELLTQ